jgi:peptidoglycan/xylan/chitin deacetylase (PgdA/CDA1 family)
MSSRQALRARSSHSAGRLLRVADGWMSRRRARLARAQGLTALRVVLSFDCDTERDIEVAASVHGRCAAAGVRPVYAVPGELLVAGADVYRDIAAGGAEFMNHGFVQHTTLDRATRTYTSSHFYDQLPRAEVERDIRAGHDAVSDVLGAPPSGFRTPHFGTFGGRDQLRWLHELLASMGYRFSSSTMPLHAVRHGPLGVFGGVVELPVAGRPSAPNRVLDSWSFRFAPGRLVDETDYVDDVRALVDWHVRTGEPGLVNLYADPSQVEDWPTFFDLLAELAPHAAPSISAVLDEVGR